eukprot:COSAG02_NODE_766_length_17389_cov_29.287045_5_plen_150_part_00
MAGKWVFNDFLLEQDGRNRTGDTSQYIYMYRVMSRARPDGVSAAAYIAPARARARGARRVVARAPLAVGLRAIAAAFCTSKHLRPRFVSRCTRCSCRRGIHGWRPRRARVARAPAVRQPGRGSTACQVWANGVAFRLQLHVRHFGLYLS